MNCTKTMAGVLAGVAAVFSAEASVDLNETYKDGFLNPPMSARPQTWWHWMNGNVSKEGITADLEAMREIGLGGATLFDAGCGVPSGPLRFASPEWFDFVKHAAAEARRLGLEICLPNCSGWSSSGGPWNPAANNMKELVRTERRYEGSCHVHEKLPPLPDAHGFAADIAVIAVPVPSADLDTMEKVGGVVTAPSAWVREIAFPEPYAAVGTISLAAPALLPEPERLDELKTLLRSWWRPTLDLVAEAKGTKQ